MLFLGNTSWDRSIVHQYVAAISASMAYSIMGAATAWPSPTLIVMASHEAPVILDSSQISWMVSFMFLGHISSAVPSGYLMDLVGRKNTCLWMASVPFTSWILILNAKSAVHLYIARYLAGVWIGTISTVIPLYVGEVAGPRLRGSLTTLNNLFLNLGTMYVYTIGPFISYSALAVACGLLTIVFFCVFAIMPESPYFLIKTNKKNEAFEVLRWLRDEELTENIESEICRIEQSIQDQAGQKGTIKDIVFDSGNRKALTISVTYSVLKRTTGSGVMQAFLSVTLPNLTFHVLTPNICVTIVGLISLISSIISTGLTVKYSRRTLLTVSCGVCTLTTAAISVWFYLNDFSSLPAGNYSSIIFISVALYFSAFNIGLGPIGTSIKGELFATNVKALSSSITTLAVAFAGFCINRCYLPIAQTMGMYFNYLIFCLSCIAGIIFTWKCVPETHNKNLEEVQNIIRRNANKKNYHSIV